MFDLPIKPMLAEPTAAPVKEGGAWLYRYPFTAPHGDFAFEPKWDGIRCVIAKEGERVLMYGRSGRLLNSEFPGILAGAHRWEVDEIVLDGEIVAFDSDGRPSFHALQRRMREVSHITFRPFDLLWLKGVDLRRMAFAVRRAQLELASRWLGPSILTPSVPEGQLLWETVVATHAEGVIVKPTRSRYTEGTRGPWMKVKTTQRRTNVVVGFTAGEGSRFDVFGALVLAENIGGKLVYAGRVGTGFTAQQAQMVLDMLTVTPQSPMPPQEAFKAVRSTQRDVTWVMPDRIATIEFSDTTADGLPRFPSFRGIS